VVTRRHQRPSKTHNALAGVFMIDYEKFKSEFSKALDEFFMAAREEFGESLRIIGIYTNDELSYFYPTCQYGDTRDISTELKNKTLSPADWNGHGYQSSLFSNVESMISKGWNADFSNFEVNSFKIRQIVLDNINISGHRFFKNSDIIFGLFCAGNQNLFYETAHKINPKNVIEMYTNQL
jgi:hypothetical protein